MTAAAHRLPEISKLTLGSAQLGMVYGIANASGQPSYEEARGIIAAAYESGITYIDTAAAYGESETVIGRALADLRLRGRVTVVTKVTAIVGENPRSAEARRQIADSVTGSLARLGVDRLDICLFHNENDVRFADEILADDRIDIAGCSVMTVNRMRDARAAGLRAVQIPASVVDARCTRDGDREIAAASDVLVFARSAYLQGLLLMPEARIPRRLSGIIPVRTRLERIAAAAGMSLAEMALRYVSALEGIRSVVVGAETVLQVRRNADFAALGPLPAEVRSAAEAAVTEAALPEALITPLFWPRPAEKDEGTS